MRMKALLPRFSQRQPETRLLLLGLVMVLASPANARQSVSGLLPRHLISSPASETHQASAKQRGGARSLTGRVVDEGGGPIADASVFASPAGVSSLSSGVAMVKVRTGLTDETGRFTLDDVAPGSYTLMGFAPGFVFADSPGQPAYYRPGDSATLQMIKGGVITGVVTASNGEAVAGIRVRAALVKEADGAPARTRSLNPMRLLQDWKTDDRGVYRIFGLEPGSYLVSAGGRGLLNLSALTVEGYDNDAPTFYPSSTRDTAVEVKVRGGDEASGIDIRFREGRGHAISGAVSGKITQTDYSAFLVTLTHASTGGMIAFAPSLYSESERTFSFNGVADGEYDLVATFGYQSNEMMTSRPRRVQVKGADVTGVELELVPVASISGRLVVEKAQIAEPKSCPPGSNVLIGETVIVARPDWRGKDRAQVPEAIPTSFSSEALDGVPDEKGEFKIRPLDAGRYRLDVDVPGETSFIRAITLPPASPEGRPVDAARNGIDLKASERLAGVTITVAQGAAGIAGRVVPAKTGAGLPSSLVVRLVPAEKETVDEVLRFFEVPIDRDGAFSFKHVAPGRYFLLAQEEPESESNQRDHQPAAWRGSTRRAKLQREAEAFNVPIQLSQCQRVTSQVLRYTPPQPAPTRPQ